jgi:hypothetical protein
MSVTKNVALFNLILQAVLIAGVFVGAGLALRRRFKQHCLLMRVLMGVQIVLIGTIMGPQFVRYFPRPSNISAFDTVLIIHHTLGLLALVLWVYINLAFTGVVKAPRRYTWFMRTAATSWTISLAMGAYVFWYLWR